MYFSSLIFVLLLVVLEYFLRRWIVGPGGQEISETDGKNVYFWGRILLAITGLSLIFFVIDISDEVVINRFLLIFLAIFFGFQSFFEWKYIKSLKAFIVSFLLMLICTLYGYIFLF
ncbi:DUF4181 domain-containing protein [Bacillus sp. FJAT-27445]|uniref:DUF4181 domain-containing protein n=1 Tax=Bacillus sp. FJAT-27445 TaxID=1679166 RepID=UPI0007442DEB